MKQSTHCRFCHIPMSVDIDENYDRTGDPLQIMKLATCNRCADLRTRFNGIRNAIKNLCMVLVQTNKLSEEDQEKTTRAMTVLFERYAKLIADWNKVPIPTIDPTVIKTLIANPGRFEIFLRNIWDQYRRVSDEPQKVSHPD